MNDPFENLHANDNATMTRVLHAMDEAGWTGQLIAVAGGSVRCTDCRTVTAAADLDIQAERRLEGTSDPDDMSLIIAAKCPSCGTPSTMVLGYGPATSDEDGDVVVALDRAETSTSHSDWDPAVRAADLESP